jgi:DNA-binding NtrC family response regulator
VNGEVLSPGEPLGVDGVAPTFDLACRPVSSSGPQMLEPVGESMIERALFEAGLCPIELRALEQAAIRNALRHAQGNRTHAAKSLGISVRTLQRKIRGWDFDGDSR